MEVMLKSKIVRETIKAKGYDLNKVETGRVKIDEDLRRLLEKLADDKPIARNNGRNKPEFTILKRGEAAQGEDSITRQPDGKEVVRTFIGREDPRGHIKTDYGSKEESDFQEGSRIPGTRSRVRGVADIRRR